LYLGIFEHPEKTLFEKDASVVRLTLLYISSEAVIPAKAEIPTQKYWIPGQARNDN